MVPKLCSALPMIHHWWHSRRPQVRARSLFSSFTPPTRPRELSATTATATTTSASCVRPIKTTWSMAIIVWVGLCRFRFVALMFRLGNFVFICAANNKNVIKDAMQSDISIVQGMRITRGGISISCSCFFNSISYSVHISCRVFQCRSTSKAISIIDSCHWIDTHNTRLANRFAVVLMWELTRARATSTRPAPKTTKLRVYSHSHSYRWVRGRIRLVFGFSYSWLLKSM